MNIMDMVKGAVSDQIMGQIGGMLGMEDNKKTSSVMDAAMGSILGGMIKKSSSPEGAKQVYDMASNADGGIMDKLGDILGGGQQMEQVQQAGGGMLEGIFGGSSQSNGIIETISKFLGMDKSLIGKLLTLAAPMLLGAIGKHVKNAGLDAIGLGSLLGEQKKHVSAALPSGLTQNLGFGDLLSGSGDLGQSAVNAANNAANTAKNATNEAAAAGGGILKLLLPLIAIAALAYVAFTMFGGAANDAVENAETAVRQGTQAVGEAAGSLDFTGLDMSALGAAAEPMQKGFSDITAGFTGLKESGEAGANDLATKIKDFSGTVDGFGLANLPEAGQGVAKTMIGQFIEKVTSMLGLQSDSIQGILKPAVDMLMEKLKPFG